MIMSNSTYHYDQPIKLRRITLYIHMRRYIPIICMLVKVMFGYKLIVTPANLFSCVLWGGGGLG